MDNNNWNMYQQPMDQYQNNYRQPMYQQPVYQDAYQANNVYEEPVTVGNWVLTMFVLCIPLVNFIMLFVWAFSDSVPKGKSNFCKACLIWILIMIAIIAVVMLLLSLIIGAGMVEGMFDFFSGLYF